jgi:hypothetical protein
MEQFKKLKLKPNKKRPAIAGHFFDYICQKL